MSVSSPSLAKSEKYYLSHICCSRGTIPKDNVSDGIYLDFDDLVLYHFLWLFRQSNGQNMFLYILVVVANIQMRT